MSRLYILLPLGAAFLIAGVTYVAHLHGAAIPVLQPHGAIALAERRVMYLTLALCAIVVVPVYAMLFDFAWAFRERNPGARAAHHPTWDHSTTLAEIVWWVVPSIIIAILAILAWTSSHQLDPYKPLGTPGNTLEVEVVALQWKWLFIYPQLGIASVNHLELPAKVPVRFEITADAPMNSLWIPSLGGQIMAMPGMETQLNLVADDPGEYDGFSGNISGTGFSSMTFKVDAVPQSAFIAWALSVANGTSTLDASAYASLAAPAVVAAPFSYAAVDSQLYTSIMTSYMAPKAAAGGGMTMP